MDEKDKKDFFSYFNKPPKENPRFRFLLPLLLFILTFITTTLAGFEWIRGQANSFDVSELVIGLPYSFSIMLFLSFHEFGHYFASRFHKVDASLPYFIPFASFLGFLNFGTFGAVIKTRTAIPTKKALLDIGASGPIAGFVISMGLVIYGFSHLPSKEFLMHIHPDYGTAEYGKNAISLTFGDSLLFSALRAMFTNASDFIPPMSEIYHYPFLCAGWFGLFVTSMNLVPVGQLDGGHIAYALLGEKKHYAVASVSMICLIILGFLGILKAFAFDWIPFGWPGWLFWSIILYFVVKIKHPPIYDFQKLDKKRKFLGWISLIIFLLSFSPTPFNIQ